MQFSSKKCGLMTMNKKAFLGTTKLEKGMIDAYPDNICFICEVVISFAGEFLMESVNLRKFMARCPDVLADKAASPIFKENF